MSEIITEDTWSAKECHRPQRFSDFIGQPAVDVLRGQLEKGTLSKTYLITGSPGDGKSSLAWLLAMKINKTKDRNHPNIHHFVATVQNGIDDARGLIEALQYSPIKKGKKVVIIEEAHGLTGKAADALLVTLENPPDHVVIILCTNEDHKLKTTVRNRCRKIKLIPLKARGVLELLKRAAEIEDVFQPYEEHKALYKALAQAFEGQNRDALNALANLADTVRVRKINKEDLDEVINSVVGFQYTDASKFLALMYREEAVKAFELFSRVTDYNGFTHILLDLNTYLLKQRTGLKPPFHYGGNILLKSLGSHRVLVKTIHKFQRVLIDMRREVTSVSAVSPEAIFLYHAVNLGLKDEEKE